MRKFIFPLETVLKDRARKEQEASVRQAKAQERLNDTMEALARTTHAIEETFNSLKCLKIDPMESFNLMFYRESLKNRQSQQKIEVEKASARVEFCRQKTIEAMMNKLIVEKLKENKLEDYKKEAAEEQQKAADEQGTQTFLRTRNI